MVGASPFLLVSPAFLVYTVSRVRENGGTLVNIRHKRGARLLTLLLGLALALPAAAERVENRAITLPENEAGVYTGELADGLPEGDGLFVCQTPDGKSWTYEGRFVKGVFEGPGRLTWTDGSVRDGQFSGGKLNGFGKYIDPDGATIYEGEWKDNECSGQGTIRKDGYVWKGTFARDKLNGDGAIYTADGELVYRGRFRDNVMADGLFYKDGVAYTVKNGENLGKARRPNEEVGYIVIAGAITLVVIVISVVLMVREARRRRQVAALDAVSSEDYQPTVPVEEPEAESRVVDCENCRASSWVRLGEEAECPYCGSPLSWRDGE